jgi:hypothetical protein
MGRDTKKRLYKKVVYSLPVVCYQKLRATLSCGPVLTFLKVFSEGIS